MTKKRKNRKASKYHHFNECGEWVDGTIMIDQISKWIEQHFY